ncbi:hypothetical protein I4U23_019439 [Adineta vaga]|nr:hypothetical protein I4U23_019439 [Adineta vaga]
MSYRIHQIFILFILFVSYVYSCQWSPTKCGCSRTPPATHHRIVGGTAAIPHSWPWIVSVQFSGSHMCGSALISEQYVLSAAHCFEKYNPKYYLSSYSFAMGHNGIFEKYLVLKAKRIVLHTSYDINGRVINDIALIELEKNVNFTDHRLGFICLPVAHANDGEKYPSIGTMTWVAGWGATKFEGPSPTVLLQVPVPITNNQGCKSSVTLPAKQVCAGYDEGKLDSCSGDSGGPLMLDKGNGIFELVGIVSFGHRCAVAMRPGIYTRVSGYIDWIDHLVKTTNPDLLNNAVIKPEAIANSNQNDKNFSYFLIFVLEILCLIFNQ